MTLMVNRVSKCTPTLGAEVSGIDLSKALNEETILFLQAIFAKYGVLIFSDQAIDDEALVRFARYFGQLQTFCKAGREDGVLPEIFRTANTDIYGISYAPDSETVKMQRVNWLWHTDNCYSTNPSKGVVMHAIKVTGDGGDTIFANAAAAYEALSPEMKDRITTLTARHSFEFLVTNHDLPPLGEGEKGRLPAAEHPLVRRHPNGRRSLYLSPPYMESIAGLSRPESVSLVRELTDWVTQDRFRYHHHWRQDDVVIWDNSWTMHRVTPFDMVGQERVMRGATILGTGPDLSTV